MFGHQKAVLEMPADGARAGGGDLEYGGFWARFVASLLDSIIVSIVSLLLMVGALFAGMGFLANLLGFLVFMLYFPLLESSARQATFGKQLLGLQVTDLDGARVSFVRALMRNLGKILSAIPLYIGFIIAAFTGRKQALHDILARCLIVRAGPSHLMKALIAAAVLFVIMCVVAYLVVMPMIQKAATGAMDGAMKGMSKEMEQAMKDAHKAAPAVKVTPPVARAPEPGAPPAAVAVPAPASPAVGKAAEKPAEKPAAVALAPAKPADKPAAVPVPAKPAMAKSAPAEAKPAPAKPAAAPTAKTEPAPQPAPAAAPAAADKPRVARRTAPRKPVVPAAVAEAAPMALPQTPRYNDVMTAVMNRDHAGAAEALRAGFWADRADSNGVTPLMAAAQNGDFTMTELLLRNGADPNRSGPGGSVLSHATRGGNAKVVDMLRRVGAR